MYGGTASCGGAIGVGGIGVDAVADAGADAGAEGGDTE